MPMLQGSNEKKLPQKGQNSEPNPFEIWHLIFEREREMVLACDIDMRIWWGRRVGRSSKDKTGSNQQVKLRDWLPVFYLRIDLFLCLFVCFEGYTYPSLVGLSFMTSKRSCKGERGTSRLGCLILSEWKPLGAVKVCVETWERERERDWGTELNLSWVSGGLKFWGGLF